MVACRSRIFFFNKTHTKIYPTVGVWVGQWRTYNAGRCTIIIKRTSYIALFLVDDCHESKLSSNRLALLNLNVCLIAQYRPHMTWKLGRTVLKNTLTLSGMKAQSLHHSIILIYFHKYFNWTLNSDSLAFLSLFFIAPLHEFMRWCDKNYAIRSEKALPFSSG